MNKKTYINFALVMAIILVLNFLGSFYYKRFDLTEEKRYSLSKPTKEFLKNLDDIVSIQVFLTGKGLPAGLKELEYSTSNILNEFKAYAGKKIEYEFVNINEYDAETKKDVIKYLKEQGLSPINLQVVDDDEKKQKIIFPGAIVKYRGRNMSITLLENQIGKNQFDIINNSIALLEYKFANAIQKLGNAKQPFVAFTQGNGELNQLQIASLLEAMQHKFFKVEGINLSESYRINPLIDIIVIAKPTIKFTEKDKYKIDQFIMNGGKVIWALEGMNAEMDSLQTQDFFMADAKDVNLGDQMFKYGVRINEDLIQDLQNTPISLVTGELNGQPQLQNFPWLFNPIMFSSEKHAIVKNLEPIKSTFVSTLDTIKNKGIKKTFLLTTSKYSKALMNPVRVFLGLVQDKPNPSNFKQEHLPTAVLLEGEFTSVFKGRLTKQFLENSDTVKNLKFKEKSKPTKMIIISDGDLFVNEIEKGKPLPLGFDRNSKINYGNKTFILNCLEYLIDDNNLIETRNKEIKLRQLDPIKTKEEKWFWQQINLILPSLLVALFGLVFYFVRKKKFAN